MRLFAPAKVNLSLHVTGRRGDGYHLLDSLVVFAGVGDWLSLEPAERLSLDVTGPRAAGVPDDAQNLVCQAAEWLSSGRGAAMVLEKHLPHAGGIGGGSSDAAAALRGLSELWGVDVPDGVQELGADLPVCLRATPARMRGIGDILADVPDLPKMWLVLVNPGVALPTGPVFKALAPVENAGLPEPDWNDFESFITWLRGTRNDLEAPAKALQPVIGDVLERLVAAPGCACARMSGSGATCFGVFEQEVDATAAAEALPEGWWAEVAEVLRGVPG